MMREHDVDVRVLRRPYEEETRDYCLRQAQWHELTEDVVQGEPVCVAAFDLNTITLDEAQGVADAPFAFDLPLERCSAFAGWFDSDFANVGSGVERRDAGQRRHGDAALAGGFFVDPTLVRDAIRRAGGRAPLATKGASSLTRQAGAARTRRDDRDRGRQAAARQRRRPKRVASAACTAGRLVHRQHLGRDGDQNEAAARERRGRRHLVEQPEREERREDGLARGHQVRARRGHAALAERLRPDRVRARHGAAPHDGRGQRGRRVRRRVRER